MGLVEGARARITPAGRGIYHARVFIVAGVHEVPFAIVLDERHRGELVLDLLVLGNPETGLANRPVAIFAGLAIGSLGGLLDDCLGPRTIIAAEHLSCPACPLENHLGACAGAGVGLGSIEDGGDLLVHQDAFRTALPMTSRRARPMASSTRDSSSSDRASVIRMPGLNCSTEIKGGENCPNAIS